MACHRRSRRFGRLREQCVQDEETLGTLMRHLFSKHEASPNGEAGKPLDEPRASGDRLEFADTGAHTRADALAGPVLNRRVCSSDDHDRRLGRSTPAGDNARTRSFENPRYAWNRENKNWTSVPLSGDTSSCGTKPQVGRPRGVRPSVCPWAFALPEPRLLSQSPDDRTRSQTLAHLRKGSAASLPSEPSGAFRSGKDSETGQFL